jgi:superfamily II DNA or RNA helicase
MNLYEKPAESLLRPYQLDTLDRTKDLYERGRGRGLRRVVVQGGCGSGKTWVAAEQTRRAREKKKRVLHIVHRRRLVDQMIATLAQFRIHASAVMEGRVRWDSDVMCASRDTLLAILKAGGELPRANLIIPDECHTAAREVYDWYLENCPDSYWTGYTASPVRPNGDSLAPPYQALVCMVPPSQLLRSGHLCPVKVFNPDALGRRRRKGDLVKPAGDPVAHWRRYADGLPTVAYASTVNDSLALMRRYLEAGVPAEHIDAGTPEEDREAIFERSRTGKTLVICNCNVLVEGVDLPWLVCCQMLRGCNSLVLWVQGPGRIMRPFPGKTHGIVLDHSAAAYDFGSPDRDYDWSLDNAATVERRNKLPKDRKPICCPDCGLMFTGKPACPECGKVLPAKRRKTLLDVSDLGDAILTEFLPEQQAAIEHDRLERLWKKTLYTGRAKGWPMRQVAAVFTQSAGVAPWSADLSSPIPPPGPEWQMPASEWLQRVKFAEGATP